MALFRPTLSEGFTLIELSVVLVIIGLIVGCVLVGRDLIHDAEIRRTVSDYERFDAAANTFRTKFNCLPGDCVDAAAFGFDGSSSGNGDGRIGQCNTDLSCLDDTVVHEYIDFWYQLSVAGLIAFAASPYAALSLPYYGADAPAGVVTPPAGIRASNSAATIMGAGAYPSGWAIKADMMFSGLGSPTLTIMPMHNFVLGTTALPSARPGMTFGDVGYNLGQYAPWDISDMDRKVDDGLPLSGRMLAWDSTGEMYLHVVHYQRAFVKCVIVDGDLQRYNLAAPSSEPGPLALCGASIRATF